MKLVILHYHLNRGGVSRVIQSHMEALHCQFADRSGPVGENQIEGEGGTRRITGAVGNHRKPSEQHPYEPLPVILLYGGRREGWPGNLPSPFSSLQVVLEPTPLLDYDNVHGRTGPGLEDALEEQIRQVLHRHGCRAEETIFHVHNHSLGKNTALPSVLGRLAEAGYPMLLQIHDFAEDFRPANYRALLERRSSRSDGGDPAWLYPQAEHVHYAVLNSRDRQVLLRAGVPTDRLHLLPNPVVGPGPLPEHQEAKTRLEKRLGIPASDRYFLYPVRAIRRKNLGEAVLCSVLAEPGVWIGVTLAPLNPVEKKGYEQWKQWTAQHGVRCVWETGEQGGLRLADNLAAAHALLSTSITEGFGMVFLESWLVGRPLLGRNLPEITGDFERLGLRLPGMWRRLAVPLDWLGAERVRERLLAVYRRVLADYQRPMQSDWADALDEKLADSAVDFGDLDEPLQQEVLEKILSDKGSSSRLRRQFLEKNPAAASLLARLPDQDALVRENARVVDEHFSPHRLGQRLWAIYQTLAHARRSGPVEGLPHPEQILESFLDLRRFRMLRA